MKTINLSKTQIVGINMYGEKLRAMQQEQAALIEEARAFLREVVAEQNEDSSANWIFDDKSYVLSLEEKSK